MESISPVLKRPRYSVYLLYWYKSTNTDGMEAISPVRKLPRYSVYFLYWYNSTNTDGMEAISPVRELPRATNSIGGERATRSRYSLYLLYWYKSTNFDAEGAASCSRPYFTCFTGTKIQSTDAEGDALC